MGPESRKEHSIYHPFPYVSHRVPIKTALLPIILTTSSEEAHKHKPLFYKQLRIAFFVGLYVLDFNRI